MTPASPMLGLALGFHPTLPAAVLGALTGVTYGLLAVGLVLIYRTSKVVNFAQGQMGIFGVAVMGLLAHNYHFPYYLALLPALAAGGVAGGVTELVVVRRLRQAPRVMTIVATLGVGALLSTIATAIYPGVQNASFLPSPTWMPTLQLGALQINQAYMAMLVFGPVAVLALTVFLRHSRYGVGIRCSSANPEAARMAGISTNNMSSLAWILAGVLSALTAVLVIPASGFASSTSFGPSLLLRALAAALLARMYSLPIAFGAGVVIGVVEEMLLYSYPNSPGFVDVMLYVIIVVALLLQRGQRGREEDKGSWAAVTAWQPLSRAVARLPEIRLARWGAGAAALSIAVAIPAMVSNSSAVIFSTIFAFSIVGLSVGIVLGLSGQLSLGQFAIAAVGAVVAFDVSERAPFALGADLRWTCRSYHLLGHRDADTPHQGTDTCRDDARIRFAGRLLGTKRTVGLGGGRPSQSADTSRSSVRFRQVLLLHRACRITPGRADRVERPPSRTGSGTDGHPRQRGQRPRLHPSGAASQA